ncbi:TatD family hydrolase [Ferruginibacter sp.]
MLINIHSHQPPAHNQWLIQNLYRHFEQSAANGYYSIGLHPWYINETTLAQQMEELNNYCNNKNVLAIGECGLDKVCSTDFALQQNAFSQQIVMANAINKPLIIHCVKAFEEVQFLLQQQKVKVPVIFHGFNKSRQLALQLVDKGYYLSFGKALQLPAMQQVLASVPLQQFFLETDDAEMPIDNIYAVAAPALQIDINTLSLQLKKNAAAVFGNAVL